MSARDLCSPLRQRIVIQQPSDSSDTIGGKTRSWTTFSTVWAAVEPIDGSELLLSEQLRAQTVVRFTLRYLTGITTAMRISYDGRFFNIRAVVNVQERDEQLILTATEN